MGITIGGSPISIYSPSIVTATGNAIAAGDGVYLTAAGWTEILDTDSAFDPVNGLLTVPAGKAGKYLILVMGRGTEVGANFYTSISIDGAVEPTQVAHTATMVSFCYQRIEALTVGQTVAIRLKASSAGKALNLAFLSIVRLSD